MQTPGNCREVPIHIVDMPVTDSQGVFAEAWRMIRPSDMLGPRAESLELSRLTL